MRLYNSLSKKIEPLKPLTLGKITMYTCGVTPDGPMHLGHAATYIYSDVLARYLLHKKFDVKFIQNITDIDDDILQKSKKEGKTWKEFVDFWTEEFMRDIKPLNIITSKIFIKATSAIPSMIILIQKLLKKKHAYESGGSIYFDVTTSPTYGSLSHYSNEQMIEFAKERGGHVEDKNKKNPLDFVLWQSASSRMDKEPFWDSPFGKGRPGWHIECSAMIYEHLGEQIDIHGGGHDLIFPHHESERAQSEGFSDQKFVGHWFHTAMVIFEGEKMSKSLGNLILVSDLLKQFSSNFLRFYILTHHYRSSWEYDDVDVEMAERQFETIESCLRQKNAEGKADEKSLKEFEIMMDHDLCTPEALQNLIVLAKKGDRKTLSKSLKILGFAF